VVRVVTWYYAVRRLSKWSETKLEIYFDKLDRAGLGRHRGSRWNKYKAGITTPSRELVEQVGRAFKGTLEVFDHPVWLLASSERLGTPALRDLVLALPRDISGHIVRPGATATSDFWVSNDLDHQAIAAQFLQSPLDRRLPQRILNDAAQGLAFGPRQRFGMTCEIGRQRYGLSDGIAHGKLPPCVV